VVVDLFRFNQCNAKIPTIAESLTFSYVKCMADLTWQTMHLLLGPEQSVTWSMVIVPVKLF